MTTIDVGRTQPRRPRATPPPQLHHPVVLDHAARRAAHFQLRVADSVTTFAGSMPFVYIHAVGFACWSAAVDPSEADRVDAVGEVLKKAVATLGPKYSLHTN